MPKAAKTLAGASHPRERDRFLRLEYVRGDYDGGARGAAGGERYSLMSCGRTSSRTAWTACDRLI